MKGIRPAVGALAVVVVTAGIAAAAAVLRATGGSPGAGSRYRSYASPDVPASAPVLDLAVLTRAVPCRPDPSAPLANRRQVRAFGAVAAVWCVEAEQTYADGEWTVQVRKASASGIGSFVAALGRADQSQTQGACAAVLISNPAIALVDRNGGYLFPRFPHDGCGQPEAALTDRITGWHVLSTSKLQLQRSRAEIDAHCQPAWKNEVAIAVRVGEGRSDGGSVLPGVPADVSLYVCVYRTGGSDPDVGTFQRGLTVTGPDAARLRSALAGPGKEANCPAQDTFAVIGPLDHGEVNVELGGCWRVQCEDDAHETVGSAEPAVVRAIVGDQ